MVLILGIAAQWISWRLGLPSILALLATGFLAGPIAGWVQPDLLLGELLFPVVSLFVAVILFEGGLSLRFADLEDSGRAVLGLVTVGAVASWAVTAGGAVWLLGLELPAALLLGAILMVTGPTVVQPLLRHLRPRGAVGPVLRWEGILIDPIGATAAVLTLQVILAEPASGATALVAAGILKTAAVGVGAGGLGAGLLVLLFQRYWVPDFLQVAVTLAILHGVFSVSDLLQPEAGLLAVTVMGVVLANQRRVTVRHILQFKENLGVLLLSSLFILLAARVSPEQLRAALPGALALLALLLVVGRPVSVFAGTAGTRLAWRERLLLAWMAPRGIVAAAVASVFSLRLEAAGIPGAEILAPTVFLVIVGTVAVYGLTAGPLGRWLGVAGAAATGVLLLGAHPLARALAAALHAAGVPVLLADTNASNVRQARMDGLPALRRNVVSEDFVDEALLKGMGTVLALTPNDEVNTLAAVLFMDEFERSQVFQLVPAEESDATADPPQHLQGRHLFGSAIHYTELARRLATGSQLKRTPLTKTYGWDELCEQRGKAPTPLFVVHKDGRAEPWTAAEPPVPGPGTVVIHLAEEDPEPPPADETPAAADGG